MLASEKERERGREVEEDQENKEERNNKPPESLSECLRRATFVRALHKSTHSCPLAVSILCAPGQVRRRPTLPISCLSICFEPSNITGSARNTIQAKHAQNAPHVREMNPNWSDITSAAKSGLIIETDLSSWLVFTPNSGKCDKWAPTRSEFVSLGLD